MSSTDISVDFTLLGVPFHTPKRKEVLEVFECLLKRKSCSLIFTPNPEFLLCTLKNREFKDALNNSTWNMPDGRGLQWATAFLKNVEKTNSKVIIMVKFILSYLSLLFFKRGIKKVLPETVTGQDTFFAVHPFFVEKQTRVFYFGAEGDVPKQMKEVMERKYPGLNIVGSCGGYPFRSKEENDEVVQTIVQAKPEVLFVALSYPRQEMWAVQQKAVLEKAGVKVIMCIGGTYDVAVGKIKRAPAWMKSLYLEWLWRLIQQPTRVKRILSAVFVFPYKILRRRLAGERDLEIY